MQVQNARRWAPRGARTWLTAAAALAIAAGVRMLLHPLVGPLLPGTAFCIAASLVEYFFGLAPALAVMLLGLGLADYLFVPPYAAITVFNHADVILLISYPLVTLLVIMLIERLRRAQFRAELIASVAQSRYEMLLRHDNERMLARRAVDETHRLLLHLSQHHNRFIFIQAVERTAHHLTGDLKVPGTFPRQANEIAPGPLFDQIDPEDIQRLRKALWPGSHRVHLKAGDAPPRLTDCLCERFTTHAGDFLVLRVED
jgi:K+-sensing histidine kinase KdpD